MNNTQLYLSIGIPMLTIILAWLASRTELSRNIDPIDRNLDRLDRSIDSFRAEFVRETSSLHAELVAIRNDHHKDLVSLMGYMVPLHERMAKLESNKG